jgi:hypothetical protein
MSIPISEVWQRWRGLPSGDPETPLRNQMASSQVLCGVEDGDTEVNQYVLDMQQKVFQEAYEESYLHGIINQGMQESHADKDELGRMDKSFEELCDFDLTLECSTSWW